jgi:NAD(P)-dependent dehydrogenase (short-subunit alcohol dehydrogenase family)
MTAVQNRSWTPLPYDPLNRSVHNLVLEERLAMQRYHGKKVVIVGGSSGIGLATAELLTAEGARVMITGRSEPALTAAREAVGAVTVRGDVTSRADASTLADRVRAEFGTVDAVFVTPAANTPAPFEAMTEAAYDLIFDGTVKGPYFTLQRLAPLLADNAGIVLITSIANVLGQPGFTAYAAAKAALRSMTRTLAREFVPRGIRVNAVSPGSVDSGLYQKVMPDEVAAQLLAQFAAENPMGRVATSVEVARAAVFLAFDATYTTGAELAVDGGVSQL